MNRFILYSFVIFEALSPAHGDSTKELFETIKNDVRNSELILKQLKNTSTPDILDPQTKNTPLDWYLSRGGRDLSVIAKLTTPFSVNFPNYLHWSTPLHIIVGQLQQICSRYFSEPEEKDKEVQKVLPILKFLIEEGASLTSLDYLNRTPLVSFLNFDDFRVIELLASPESVLIPNEEGLFPIEILAQNPFSSAASFKVLLKFELDQKIRSSALSIYAQYGGASPEVFNLLQSPDTPKKTLFRFLTSYALTLDKAKYSAHINWLKSVGTFSGIFSCEAFNNGLYLLLNSPPYFASITSQAFQEPFSPSEPCELEVDWYFQAVHSLLKILSQHDRGRNWLTDKKLVTAITHQKTNDFLKDENLTHYPKLIAYFAVITAVVQQQQKLVLYPEIKNALSNIKNEEPQNPVEWGISLIPLSIK